MSGTELKGFKAIVPLQLLMALAVAA